MSEATEHDAMTIDQLAARSSVPSRTIRQYQTAGLLSPPDRRGRVGYYGQGHVRRLALIDRLQERGYSIAGMRDLFEAWEAGRGLDSVFGEHGNLVVPADEQPILCTTTQLIEMFPAASSAAVRRELERVSLIRRISKGGRGWAIPARSALVVATELVGFGVAPDVVIAMFGRLRDTLGAAADDVVDGLNGLGGVGGVGGVGGRDGRDGRDGPGGDEAAIELLRRMRAPIARAVATLFIDSVGMRISPAQLDAIRVGSVDDRRADAPPGRDTRSAGSQR